MLIVKKGTCLQVPGYVSRVHPKGLRPMNPEWVLSSKEAQKVEMNMYPQGKVISIFQKKYWIPGCQSSQLYSAQIEKKKKMTQTKT